MGSTLTDYLMNIKDDLSKLKEIRNYLNSNSESQCSVTWQTIEAFNSILTNCNISETADVQALNILLDSFRCMATNNSQDNEVWKNFEFEMGIVSMKILSAIEQSNMFEILFHKFLSIISTICDKHSELWKGIARQILNVFINKNFSFDHLETCLQSYASILRKIKSSILHNFAQQNLHLLRTFSLKIQHLGDFDVQCCIVEIIFLHFLKNKDLIRDFFVEDNTQLQRIFEKLDFNDFEESAQIYLNALNKSLGSRRRVFSINCVRLKVGNLDLNPGMSERLIQLNANEMSRRLTTKYANFSLLQSSEIRVINISFDDLITVKIERHRENRLRLIIKSNNLNKIDPGVTSEEIVCLVAEDDNPHGEVFKFKDFLESSIGKKKQKKKKNEKFEKMSQASNIISIDRSVEGNEELKVVPLNHIDNDSVNKSNHGLNRIIPQALSLMDALENHKSMQMMESYGDKQDKKERNNQCTTSKYFHVKEGEERSLISGSPRQSIKSPERQATNTSVSQELTPNSFVRSLNENLGLNSPSIVQSFEEILDPSPFEQNSSEKVNHRLFRKSDTIFDVLNGDNDDNEKSSFEELKSNKEIEKQLNLFSNRKKLRPRKTSISDSSTAKNNRSQLVENSESQNDFLTFNNKKKKPSLPKIFDNNKTIKRANKKGNKKKDEVNSTEKKDKSEMDQAERPSLLDPNGYTYQRWLQPTTSERSNFWLNKLATLTNKKSSESHVYEFSDDFELMQDNKTRKKGNRKKQSKKPKNDNKKKNGKSKISFQQYKKLMVSSEKFEEPAANKKNLNEEQEENSTVKFSPLKNTTATASYLCGTDKEPFPTLSKNSDQEFHHGYDNLIIGRSLSSESIYEDVNPCEQENGRLTNDKLEAELPENNLDDMESECVTTIPVSSKKRERSEDENSLGQNVGRKKNAVVVPHWLKMRLQKFEEKYRRETNEIVEACAKANSNIFNLIYRQQTKDMLTYLRQAEELGKSLMEEKEFTIRKERVQKLIIYFRKGCSVQELSHTMENTCEKIRKAFDGLHLGNPGRYSGKISTLNERLKTSIEREVEKHIRKEIVANRNRLLQYATMFNIKFSAI